MAHDSNRGNSKLEYLGRQEPIDAEWTEVGTDPKREIPKESAASEFKAWVHDTVEATIHMFKNALLLGVVVVVVLVLIGLAEGDRTKDGSSSSQEPTSEGAPQVEEASVPPESEVTSNVSAAPVARENRWPALQPQSGKFFAYTLSEGRDFPLTVIVNGGASGSLDNPDLRSTTVMKVANGGLIGSSVEADTMIFDCNGKTTTNLQEVIMSEAFGTNTKVFNTDTMEIKKLDAITAPAFNMVCNNGWDRLAEMVIEEKNIEGFVQARMKATK